jgi:hypothetical protein
LREARLTKGLSHEELAELGEMDRTYPSLLERGLRMPSLYLLFQLAQALDVHAGVLVSKAFDEYCRVCPRVNPIRMSMGHPIPVRPRFLRNPLRALDVLEATLNGRTLTQCAERFGISAARCDQLTRLSVTLLLDSAYTKNEPVPPHNWNMSRKRMAHRAFWLRLIARARGTIESEGFGPRPGPRQASSSESSTRVARPLRSA